MRTITRPLAAIPAILLAILSSGCAAEDPAPDSGSSGAPLGALSGRAFLSTGVTQAGKPHALARGTRISLQFSAGSLSANGGCNSLGGDAAYTDDSLVVTPGLSMTEMACDEALMDQDTWLAGLLTAEPDITLDGDTLTLTSGDTVITLLDEETAEPDRPLVGTAWILDAIGVGGGDDGTVSSVPTGVESSLGITEEGRLNVAAGCNSGGASVEVGDGTLTIGPEALTLRGCGGAPGEVEAAVLAVLDGEVGYAIDGRLLTLTQGGDSLTYRAAATPLTR